MADSSLALVFHRPRRITLFSTDCAASVFTGCVQPLSVFLGLPSLLYVATLGIFLFRPPDLELHHLDRIAFIALFTCVLLRAFFQKRKLPGVSSVSLPMLGLLALSLFTAMNQPYNAQTWSLFAAKFLVPFTLFHLAQLVFSEERSFAHFEWFCLLALGYLTVTSVASLLGATWLIYPKYILNESLGIHTDRARGPLLQAVANGMALNLLGLFAMDSWRRRRLRGALVLFLSLVPIAILATMTRAVWLSFAGSVIGLLVLSREPRIRKACAAMAIAGTVAILFCVSMSGCRQALQDRLEERSPVEFRLSIYEVSWDMVWEKPWLGWGQNQMPAEIAKRMSDYRPDTYCAHSSYLEILIEQGFIGLAIFVWMIVGLIRLCLPRPGKQWSAVDNDFRRLWIVMLGVYLLNGAFVVVNYQFINALLFTIAGIVAARPASSRNVFQG
jgi:O-antigen ligase